MNKDKQTERDRDSWHHVYCNADNRKPIGCDMCSCPGSTIIKKLRSELAKKEEEIKRLWKANKSLDKDVSNGTSLDYIRLEEIKTLKEELALCRKGQTFSCIACGQMAKEIEKEREAFRAKVEKFKEENKHGC